jgi:hypothetical protein
LSNSWYDSCQIPGMILVKFLVWFLSNSWYDSCQIPGMILVKFLVWFLSNFERNIWKLIRKNPKDSSAELVRVFGSFWDFFMVTGSHSGSWFHQRGVDRPKTSPRSHGWGRHQNRELRHILHEIRTRKITKVENIQNCTKIEKYSKHFKSESHWNLIWNEIWRKLIKHCLIFWLITIKKIVIC